MLSRNFSRLYLKPLVLVTTLAVSVSAHGSALLDTNGKPLPEDFGALIQLLSESDEAKTKVLGLSTEDAETAEPSKNKKNAEKDIEVKPSKNKAKPVESSVEENTDESKESTVEAEAPKKNSAFHNVELARRLYDALDVGDAARVKWMLQSGAGNVYETETNDTSLRLAIRKGWASVVRVLLEREPNLEHELPGQVNLLHEASVKGAYDIAKMLVAAGVDPEAKTSKNWTNLHLAARYGHVDVIRYYLSLGLDPDDRNSEGNTAHWLASHLRHYQAAGYLSSRTNASSYQIFDDGKGKKGSKKKRARKRKAALEFTPAQLEAILGQ